MNIFTTFANTFENPIRKNDNISLQVRLMVMLMMIPRAIKMKTALEALNDEDHEPP